MRDDRQRMFDILEALENIEKYAEKGYEAFFQDELIQVWIVHHIEIIGEAARSLSDSFLKRHPQIPWSDIIAMRNVLAHQYFGIDLEEVWTTVHTDLPKLKKEIERILKDTSQISKD